MLTKRNLGWFTLNPGNPGYTFLQVPNGILNQMPGEGLEGRLATLGRLCLRVHGGGGTVNVKMNAQFNPTCCLIQLPCGATDATVDSLCQLIMENRVE